MRQPKPWISLFILVVIGLHALPVISYQGFRQTRWPILAWAMYAKSYRPGPVQTMRRRILAVTASGHQIELSPYQVGVSRPALGKSFARPLSSGDTATARELFRRLNRGRADPVMEVRLESETFTVTDSGVVRQTHPSAVYRADSLPTP